MSYGAPIRMGNFAGLDLRRKEARNDATALVFTNMELRQVGTANKRHGMVRTVDKKFSGAVKAIIPTRHCYFLEQFLYGIDPTTNGPIVVVVGPTPKGCGRPDPVTNLVVTPDLPNEKIDLAWTLPKDTCVSGILILRDEGEDPINPRAFGPGVVLVFFGPPIASFSDVNVEINVDYHYGVFTFFAQGA